MNPYTALLDDLLATHVTPVLKEAGFCKASRRYTAGQAPENLVLLQFRPWHSRPEEVGFHVEWSVIPTAVCAFHNRDRERPARPNITWGIISNRVEVPAEMAAPINAVAPDYWTFPVSDGIDRCGAALARLLTSGGLLGSLLEMRDRDVVLQAFHEGRPRSELPTTVPTGWPWRYLAMYIDDADPATLARLLAPLEVSYPDDEWVAWWRRRLDNRLAAQAT